MKTRFQNQLEMVADEPYRIFFPFALLAGIAGVILWPLFYGGYITSFYPLQAHARMMIEGFVGGFAVGFIGTALPKLLNAPHLRLWQVLLMLLMYLSYCVLHMLGHDQPGDLLFSAMLVILLSCLAVRFKQRKAPAPSGIILAPMGLIAGATGAAWSGLVLSYEGDPHVMYFANRLLYQAFILLPILGVGSFIFPMILGTQKPYVSQLGLEAKRRWRKEAALAIAVGILIITSYWIEYYDNLHYLKAMSAARMIICFIWLVKVSNWIKRKTVRGIMAFALRAGIVCLLGGMLGVAILGENPLYKIALDHSLYIGGFGLITMIVATRVIFGHSGQGSKCQSWNKALIWSTGLLLFGMLTRISADFIPVMRISHHIYAAGCWVVVSIIWGLGILPSVRKQPPPPVLRKPSNNRPSIMDLNFRK